ncbi:glycosyltransferase family 2 protein [Infirmifilum sp. SLHALR2]
MLHNYISSPNNLQTSVSIVIPTYFRPTYLKLLLESVERMDYDLSRVEVIVVRDPADSDAQRAVEEFAERCRCKGVRVLVSEVNSASRKRNMGIVSASTNIVLVVDDDIVLNPETLKRAVELLWDERVVAVGFPALSPNPSLSEKLHHGRFLGVVVRGVNTVMPVTAFKKDILINYVGLYREDMGPPSTIHEDWELGSRIRKAGFEVLVDGLTPQVHEPLINPDKEESASSSRSRIKVEGVLKYVKSYINKDWRTFFEVMRSSPLSQRLEYAFYFIAPWIFVALLPLSPLHAVLYATALTSATLLYSLLRRYYKMFSPADRVLYPLLLLLARILRTNLSVVGYLKSLIVARIGGSS